MITKSIPLEETIPFTITKRDISEAGPDGSRRMFIEGIFQRAGDKNANGRIYPLSLWTKILANERLKENMSRRRVLGELDHPDAPRSTKASNASHLVLDHWLGEDGKTIMGRVEVLNTAKGADLRALFEGGVELGISSRGSGTVKRLGSDVIVQEDFNLETYDFVANPSTFGAYPKQVNEATDEESEEKPKMTLEQFHLLEQRARQVLRVPTTGVEVLPLIEAESLRCIAELNEARTSLPEVSNIATTLALKLEEKRNEAINLTESALFGKTLIGTVKALKPVTEESDEDDDDKKKKKKGEVEEGPGRPVSTVWPESGWELEVPQEARPGQGDGWAINPGDAGVLTGYGEHVNPWMHESKGKKRNAMPLNEEWDEDEDDDKKKKKEMKEAFLKGAYKFSKHAIQEAAPKSDIGRLSRAYVELAKVLKETQDHNKVALEAHGAIVKRLQERFAGAVREGKITVEGTVSEDAKAKIEQLMGIQEELVRRCNILKAAYYAESSLRRNRLSANADAVKAIAEVMKSSPTVKSIDEVLSEFLSSSSSENLTEETQQTSSRRVVENRFGSEDIDNRIAAMNESFTDSTSNFDEAELAEELSEAAATGRSR